MPSPVPPAVPGAGFLGLVEAAALIGGHCWVERHLFEWFGTWVSAVEAPATKLLLDRHSQHAAWRATQWWDRLPVLAHIERAGLVVAPSGWSGLDAVAFPPPPGAKPAAAAGTESSVLVTCGPAGSGPPGGPEGPGGADGTRADVALLSAAARVLLPRAAVAYRRHLARTTVLADGPTIRTLHQVITDVDADWVEAETALQALIVSAADVDLAASIVTAAECRLIA